MVVAPSFDRAAATALAALNSGATRAAIGLHVTLTGPFKPIGGGFRPLVDGAFPPLGSMLQRAVLRRLDLAALQTEVALQLQAFIQAFGRAPDFVDGHQHVHLFPQVRDAVLAAVRQAAPDAWLRQCGRNTPFVTRFADHKALLLDVLSSAVRRRAAAVGIKTNTAFAGTYDFRDDADFAVLFPRFLQDLPDGGLVMCHPGFVDDELRRLDPLTDLREREHAFFVSDAFPSVLAAHGIALARPA
jgi:predicted glycoside hydrolase/deacetylase ChbG (UPF0249 family)